MAKRQRKIPGSLLLIDLKNGKYAFARIIEDSRVCIYDLYSDTPDINQLGGMDKIISLPKLFHVTLYDSAITKGVFVIVGKKELSQQDILDNPPRFTQDIGNLDDCILYYPDGRVIEAKKEDCIGVERFAVWEDYNLIERIIDHFEGRKNSFIEETKVRLK